MVTVALWQSLLLYAPLLYKDEYIDIRLVTAYKRKGKAYKERGKVYRFSIIA